MRSKRPFLQEERLTQSCRKHWTVGLCPERCHVSKAWTKPWDPIEDQQAPYSCHSDKGWTQVLGSDSGKSAGTRLIFLSCHAICIGNGCVLCRWATGLRCVCVGIRSTFVFAQKSGEPMRLVRLDGTIALFCARAPLGKAFLSPPFASSLCSLVLSHPSCHRLFVRVTLHTAYSLPQTPASCMHTRTHSLPPHTPHFCHGRLSTRSKPRKGSTWSRTRTRTGTRIDSVAR